MTATMENFLDLIIMVKKGSINQGILLKLAATLLFSDSPVLGSYMDTLTLGCTGL